MAVPAGLCEHMLRPEHMIKFESNHRERCSGSRDDFVKQNRLYYVSAVFIL